MPTMADHTQRWPMDRELLRHAGEHLGTLAERVREHYLTTRDLRTQELYDRVARLDRLSREVLEIANG